MKKLPKTIYVQLIDGGTEDEYLRAESDIKEIADDGSTGVYELKEVRMRRTEIHLD